MNTKAEQSSKSNEGYTLFVPSNRPELVAKLQNSLHPFPVNHIDGNGAPSMSWLFNQAIVRSPTEIVIIFSDKCLPEPKHVLKLLRLLDEGFAFVGLSRFGFFGMPKETVRTIGFFDERFRSGGFEDDDFMYRLLEANLGCYETEEVGWLPIPTTWNYGRNKEHFESKWAICPGPKKYITRLIPEKGTSYDLGPSQPRNFLAWNRSVLSGFYVNLDTVVSSHGASILKRTYWRTRAFIRSLRIWYWPYFVYQSLPAPIRNVVKRCAKFLRRNAS